MATYLLMRRPEPDGFVAAPVPPGADPVELAGIICQLAEPGWHDRTDWCCVDAKTAGEARWPNPEPWAPTITPPEKETTSAEDPDPVRP